MNPRALETQKQVRARARWAVLISGRGSNLGALLDLSDQIDIRVVVSSNESAAGLLRARRAGVPIEIAPFEPGSKKIDWSLLTQRLRARGVTHIVLSGFMKIVPPLFVAEWRGKMINLHPSLLPAYPGLKSIEGAHRDRKPIGVTVHEVNEGVDSGAIILQRVTLSENEVSEYSLASSEFLVHVDEQRLLKDAVLSFGRQERGHTDV